MYTKSRYQEWNKFEAMCGMGIDRHLFGSLYLIAKWLNVDPLPCLFQDKVSNFVTNTSLVLMKYSLVNTCYLASEAN